MKSKIVLLVLLASASFTCVAQYSEWKEFGLKGPVQSVTSHNYSSPGYDTTNLEIPDSSKFTFKSVRFFTEKGMVEWYFCTYGYLFDTGTDGIRFTTYVSYEFDNDNTKIRASAHTKKMRADTVISVSGERYQYKWMSPYNYVESVHDSTGTTLVSSFEYQLDSSFFIIRETQLHEQKFGDSQYVVKIDYSKNDSGQIVTCSQTNNYSSEIVILTYNYKSFDMYGNPTCFIVYERRNDLPTKQFLVVREYSYFSE